MVLIYTERIGLNKELSSAMRGDPRRHPLKKETNPWNYHATIKR
jgi:hypothetical protein